MAILTGDHGMVGALDLFNFVFMTFVAVLAALVLCRIVLPLLLIAQTVVAKGVATLM